MKEKRDGKLYIKDVENSKIAKDCKFAKVNLTLVFIFLFVLVIILSLVIISAEDCSNKKDCKKTCIRVDSGTDKPDKNTNPDSSLIFNSDPKKDCGVKGGCTGNCYCDYLNKLYSHEGRRFEPVNTATSSNFITGNAINANALTGNVINRKENIQTIDIFPEDLENDIFYSLDIPRDSKNIRVSVSGDFNFNNFIYYFNTDNSDARQLIFSISPKNFKENAIGNIQVDYSSAGNNFYQEYELVVHVEDIKFISLATESPVARPIGPLVPVINPPKGSNLLPSRPLVPVIFPPKDTKTKPASSAPAPVNSRPIPVPQPSLTPPEVIQIPVTVPEEGKTSCKEVTPGKNSNLKKDLVYFDTSKKAARLDGNGPVTAYTITGFEVEGFKKALAQFEKDGNAETFSNSLAGLPKRFKILIAWGSGPATGTPDKEYWHSTITKKDLINNFFKESFAKFQKQGLENTNVDTMMKLLNSATVPEYPAGSRITISTGTGECLPTMTTDVNKGPVTRPPKGGLSDTVSKSRYESPSNFKVCELNDVDTLKKFFTNSALLRDNRPSDIDEAVSGSKAGIYGPRLKSEQYEMNF
jgi:hypothetical protein